MRYPCVVAGWACNTPVRVQLAGEVVVEGGPTRRIYKSARPRNPDNTVNYTLLELM